MGKTTLLLLFSREYEGGENERAAAAAAITRIRQDNHANGKMEEGGVSGRTEERQKERRRNSPFSP